jgi:hypothetical protein
MAERFYLGEDLTRFTADMVRKEFQVSNLESMNFKNMKLRGADFENENLQHANFTGASLRSTNFKKSNLESADFKDADLRWTKLQGANLLFAKNLTARMLSQAKIDDKTVLPTYISREEVEKGKQTRSESKERRGRVRRDTSDRRKGGDRRQNERDPDSWI